ncbi:DNA polymerase III subunit gamma/tau [Flavobacterium sediminis]|uniref:DNA polymerase III subunit gamma/tau n=1 Tax=Flavobacterium sediminis TaxID=2201181 RepID=UPI001FE8240F|nr:DNA polymerase III subunit gamma/tau [Flavobacterium sediminis]
MPDAISLHYFKWRKKKAKSYIIPAQYFRNNSYTITETVKPIGTTETKVATQIPETDQAEPDVSNKKNAVNPVHTTHSDSQSNVSALSLASIRARKELEAKQQHQAKTYGELPKEKFSETDMLLQWNKFAQRLSDQGKKLMATYMQMNDPVLEEATIKLELPNESTKEEFLQGSNELLGYLRGKLHNHDITIEVIVNESPENKYAFTPIEKFEKLKELNPSIELLKRLFDLDI